MLPFLTAKREICGCDVKKDDFFAPIGIKFGEFGS
jgi:hypothetical protein